MGGTIKQVIIIIILQFTIHTVDTVSTIILSTRINYMTKIFSKHFKPQFYTNNMF